MDRAAEERWRIALDKKGQHVVRQELDLRPGRPGDVLYDIGDEPPYPTRAFCEAWCRGTPTGSGGISAMIVIMSILLLVCSLKAAISWSPDDPSWLASDAGAFHPTGSPTPSKASTAAAVTGGSPTAGGQSTQSAPAQTDAIQNGSAQNSTAQNTTAQNNSLISTQATGSIRSGCTAVASAGNLTTVQPLPACSKLGQPFLKSSSGASPHS